MAVLAGAASDVALRTGLAMTVVQFGIGALNDVVDAPRDAGRKPGKPIPAGAVDARAGRLLVVAAFALGLLLAASVRPLLAALTVVVIGIGLAYDLSAKGTMWSWLPFAVGIPILPVYGWVAATGGLDRDLAIVIPCAVVAGGALAIGNALVDVERDRDAGISSVAIALGPSRAAVVAAIGLALVTATAIGTAVAAGTPAPATLVLGGAGVAAVVAASAGGRGTPRSRESAWRLEGIALGVLALTWVATVPG